MRSLRTPFFILAIVALLIAMALEVGSKFALGGSPISVSDIARKGKTEMGADSGIDPKGIEPGASRPGLGIPYLAFLDTLLLLAVGLMGLSLLLPERIHGRIQGIITLVVTFFDIIFSFMAIIAALTLLLTIVGLFPAVPLGTRPSLPIRVC